MYYERWISSKKMQKLFDRLVKWRWLFFRNSHGFVFTNYITEGKSLTERYFTSILDKLKTKNLKKMASFEGKNFVPPERLSDTYYGSCNGQNSQIGIWIVRSFTLFTWSVLENRKQINNCIIFRLETFQTILV